MVHYILVYSHPDEGGRHFELTANRSYRMGSERDNDIVLGQKDISRHHAILRVFEGRFHVTDLNSKNGTFVNGKQLTSGEFLCGDQLHLSSARMVIVEEGSDVESVPPELQSPGNDGDSGEHQSDTVGYRAVATSEDVVTLLEKATLAVSTGAAAEPLGWAVERMGVVGAVVLYRDESGRVAVVTSAGDLGPLVRHGGSLADLFTDWTGGGGAPRIREIREFGETLLVGSLRNSHLLVLRYTGHPPAVADVRALMAALELILEVGPAHGGAVSAAARARRGPSAAEAADKAPPDLNELAALPLAEAREIVERWLVRTVLDGCGGNQTRACRQLGLSRAGLFKKIKRLKISS